MELKPRRARKIIIEREEYEALMAELPTPEFELQPPHESSELAEKVRKIEFYMMIVVGLLLVVLLLGTGH